MNKFSIITATFNSDNFLSNNLKSVITQNFLPYEHIFIDNSSKDKTLEIINSYKKKVPYKVIIISKIDKGIYFAFNEGFRISSGNYISYLNSDDYFYSRNTLRDINSVLLKKKYDVIYGNVKIIDRFSKKKKIIRDWKSSIVLEDYYKIAHPSFFISSEIKRVGFFDVKFRIASDLDFIIRSLNYSKCVFFYNRYLVYQRTGGESQKILNIVYSIAEVYKILIKNRIKNKLLFIIKKFLYKIFQLRIINFFLSKI
jgi:glycosyltransferase